MYDGELPFNLQITYSRGMFRRVRYEIARPLNRLRKRLGWGDRWTQTTIGDVQRVSYSDRNIDLRPGTSDFGNFLEIFECRNYDCSRLPNWRRILESGTVLRDPIIIDAGANIGMSALWFRRQFPYARVIAIEPDPANYAELVRHTQGDRMVTTIHAGLAARSGFLQMEDPGLGEVGFRTKAADSGIPAITLAELVKEADPFILKIDIEGAEADLFDDPELLDRFKVIFIEPHDWALPGKGTFQSFLKAISSLNRDFIIQDNNIASVKPL